MNTVSERFEYYRKQKGLSYTALGKILGITGDAVRKASDRNNIKEFYINTLSDKLGVSKNWLMSGEGDMNNRTPNDFKSVKEYLKSNTPRTIINEPAGSDYRNDHEDEFYENTNGNTFKALKDGTYSVEVNVVPFSAHARYVFEYSNDAEVFGDWETVTFIVDKIGKGNYMGFKITGDSMNGGSIDDTPDKAIVLGRELGRQHWKDGFKQTVHGWIIITHDNILFKDIVGLDNESGEIICHSRNKSPEYSDFTYNLNNVHQIFKVIKRTF